MKTVGKDLGSYEKALEYNKTAVSSARTFRACIGSLACVNCFHIISDSICCCGGIGTCPNCGHKENNYTNLMSENYQYGDGFAPTSFNIDSYLKPLTLKVKKLSENATLPSRAESGAAGYDLFAAETRILKSKERALIKTDISIEIPEGYYGRVAPKSGLAWKLGIDVLGGVIDSSYRGPLGIILYNTGDLDFGVETGKAIAQLVLEKIGVMSVEEVQELSSTERGQGGFGSSKRCS